MTFDLLEHGHLYIMNGLSVFEMKCENTFGIRAARKRIKKDAYHAAPYLQEREWQHSVLLIIPVICLEISSESQLGLILEEIEENK